MFEGQRLSNLNVRQYVNLENPIMNKYIHNIPFLLQSNYGGDSDCVLVSITTLIKYLLPNLEIIEIYNQIEQIAKKYGYTSSFGTASLTIKTIINKILNLFQLPQKAKSYYLKNIGFNYENIKYEIDNNRPIILNLWKDGRNFYKNHTVLITGYYYTKNFQLLIIHDNWYQTNSYIDYNKLSTICSIQTIQ